MNRKKFEKSPEHVNHDQKYKLNFVIRNTGTGAYLCDEKLNTKVFRTIFEAERERERLHLSKYAYETKVIVVRERVNMAAYIKQ